MTTLILQLWQAWHEARVAYANRYLHHRIGS